MTWHNDDKPNPAPHWLNILWCMVHVIRLGQSKSVVRWVIVKLMNLLNSRTITIIGYTIINHGIACSLVNFAADLLNCPISVLSSWAMLCSNAEFGFGSSSSATIVRSTVKERIKKKYQNKFSKIHTYIISHEIHWI